MWKFSCWPSTARLQRVATSVAAVTAILLCHLGVAFSSDEHDSLAKGVRPMEIGGASGLAYIDLPMRLRARFDTTYSDRSDLNNPLARPYAAGVGPGVQRDRSLESRVSLTRSISDKIEIGIVCGAWSPLGNLEFFDFERVTVAAMIRIVP